MAFSVSMVAGLSGNILNREKSFTRPSPSVTEFGNIKFEAAIKQIETDLKATSGQVSPVLGAFIILQGVGPLLRCPISEIKGRKVKIPYPRFLTHVFSLLRFSPDNPQPAYIASIVISLVGCVAAAMAKTIEILIGMRVIQAIG